jgi:hypothetical protein
MSKTLEELGYEKTKERCAVCYKDGCKEIIFDYTNNSVNADMLIGDTVHATYLTMEELKAIYKYCEDNKWI